MTGHTTGRDLAGVFAAAGADGYLHAMAIDGGPEVSLAADELVVSASVFKIPLMLEVAAQAVEGRFSLTDRVRVAPAERVLGPTGISAMLDEVEVSVRDLAHLMMSVSDNTATDVLLGMVGLDAVNQRLADLGLARTALVGGCRELLGTLVADGGLQIGQPLQEADPVRLLAARSLQPEQTTRTTARETTELLRLIWSDQAAAAEACAEVRRIMALQVWPHRLRAGFLSTVNIAAKTGTLITWRNEAGVIERPDGRCYAVSVFTRAHTIDAIQPAIDAAIGAAARQAIDCIDGQEAR